jgi:hypothetical protein
VGSGLHNGITQGGYRIIMKAEKDKRLGRSYQNKQEKIFLSNV